MILIRQKNTVIQDFESCEHKDYKRDLNALWQHEISQAWKTKWAVFKIQGFVCKRFLPSPPLPSLFSRGNSLPLCPWTPQKLLLRLFKVYMSEFPLICLMESTDYDMEIKKNGYKHYNYLKTKNFPSGWVRNGGWLGPGTSEALMLKRKRSSALSLVNVYHFEPKYNWNYPRLPNTL